MVNTRQRRRIVDAVTQRTATSSNSTKIDLIRSYANEIHSDFNPILYEVVASSLPWLLQPLLGRATPGRLCRAVFSRRERDRHLVVTGDVLLLRHLAQRGTVIVVPMHASHLDSLAVGIALRREGLPRVLYGAGLNLFRNRVQGFLLASFGAYKVDRNNKDPLYKETLKQYVTFSLEKGKHNLFFPGGTRSRDGKVEQHLKLGLLGCGLSAYIAGLRDGRKHPDVFILPVALSHEIVPEAELLTTQRGAHPVPAPAPRSGWATLRAALRMETRVHIHLCQPLDVFGNAVDGEGVSRDMNGTPVDRRARVEENGMAVFRKERDREYTRALGAVIANSWLHNAPVLRTQVAAFAVAEVLGLSHPNAAAHPDQADDHTDPPPPTLLPSAGFEDVLGKIAALLPELRSAKAAGVLRLEELLETIGPEEVFAEAREVFEGYHAGNVFHLADGRVYSRDPALLHFYGARIRQWKGYA